MRVVNGILLHHNIEKQMSDSRGEVAYLMADISAVKEEEIRDLFQSLEELSCMFNITVETQGNEANSSSVHPDKGSLLDRDGCHVSVCYEVSGTIIFNFVSDWEAKSKSKSIQHGVSRDRSSWTKAVMMCSKCKKIHGDVESLFQQYVPAKKTR
jgi:hypothetical protein